MQHADHPDRIAVSAGGDAAAFAVGPTPGGPTEATGLWYGPLSGQPAKISDLVPDTNLAFAPQGSAFALAVHDGEGSRLIVADPAASQPGWAEHRLPVFAEQVTWTADGLVVLAADPGADTASLTSGKPLAGEAEDPVVARAAAGWRRLWLVDAATGAATPVSPDDLAVWEFAPVPGGGAVVGVGLTLTIPNAYGVLKLLPDGRPDPSFGDDGRVEIPSDLSVGPAGGIAVMPDGDILLASSDNQAEILRLDGTGKLDPTWGGGDGILTSDSMFSVDALAVRADGGFFIAGSYFSVFANR